MTGPLDQVVVVARSLPTTAFDHTLATSAQPMHVRSEAIRNRIVPLLLHRAAKPLRIAATGPLLFRSAHMALLGRSRDREDGKGEGQCEQISDHGCLRF